MNLRPGIVLALALCAGAAAQVYHWPQIADDTFIFLRYADHLAAGAGPVWNVGEEPVEGFSSPLWVAILALASWLDPDTLVVAKACGIAALLATALASGALAHALSSKPWAAVAAVCAVVVSKPLHYWAPSGMETGLYCALVVGSIALLMSRREIAGAILLGAAGVTRPEGPLLVAVVSAAHLWGGAAAPRPTRWVVPALAAFPALAYEIIRIAYFGEVLPNTYYAKLGEAWTTRLLPGTVYCAMGILLWASAVAAWACSHTQEGGTRAERARSALPLAASAALLAAVAWGGGDWMWHQRLLCPVLPLLAGSLAAAASRLLAAGSVATGGAIAVMGAAAFAAMGVVTPAEIARGLGGGTIPPAAIQEGTLTAASREVGEYLRASAPPGSLIAVNHAGAVPYYSGLPAIDMTGLNDHHIAHDAAGGLHGKFDPDYVLGRRPRYVVLNSRVEPNARSTRLADGRTAAVWYWPGYWEGETALVAHEEFRRSYRFVPRYWAWQWSTPENYILVAERIGE